MKKSNYFIVLEQEFKIFLVVQELETFKVLK